MVTPMSVSDLAQVLFNSPLQESDHPTPDQIRAVIEARLHAGVEVCDDCRAYVAQEAGDHPDFYVARMHWALVAVMEAYQPAA